MILDLDSQLPCSHMADSAEIMGHVRWTRRHTALYYVQPAKVLNPSGASAKLVLSIVTDATYFLAGHYKLERICLCFPRDLSRCDISF